MPKQENKMHLYILERYPPSRLKICLSINWVIIGLYEALNPLSVFSEDCIGMKNSEK